MLLSLYDKALRGDVRATTSIINTMMKLDPAAGQIIQDQEQLTDTDAVIIADFLRRNRDATE